MREVETGLSVSEIYVKTMKYHNDNYKTAVIALFYHAKDYLSAT